MNTRTRLMTLAVAASTALTACEGPAPMDPEEDLGPDDATAFIVQPSDGDTYWVAPPVPAGAEETGPSLAAPASSQVVIDFEILASPGVDNTLVTTYLEDGFTLVNATVPTTFGAFASPQSGNWRFVGSTTLFNNHLAGVTVLTKDDGSSFDVMSIDLAEMMGLVLGSLIPVESTTIPFTGTRADASTVSVTFTTDGVFGLETFTFSGFTNLTSLSWDQVYPWHQFDNITLGPADPTNKDECRNGGWADFGFQNQGLCIRFVNTGKDSR
jgi:hypothetical protein